MLVAAAAAASADPFLVERADPSSFSLDSTSEAKWERKTQREREGKQNRRNILICYFRTRIFAEIQIFR